MNIWKSCGISSVDNGPLPKYMTNFDFSRPTSGDRHVTFASLRQATRRPANRVSMLKRKRPRSIMNVAFIYAGNDLLSHTLSRAVPSARRGLTSVFGMGTGGTPAVRSPTTCSRQPSAVSHQLNLNCGDLHRRWAANFSKSWRTMPHN